jgi:hypothetical protein
MGDGWGVLLVFLVLLLARRRGLVLPLILDGVCGVVRQYLVLARSSSWGLFFRWGCIVIMSEVRLNTGERCRLYFARRCVQLFFS